MSANPLSLGLSGTGSTYALTTQVQETGYTGAFNESDNCTGVATVSPTATSGPSAIFTVTGTAAGTCTVTVSDTHSQNVQIAVTVTTQSIGIDAKVRKP